MVDHDGAWEGDWVQFDETVCVDIEKNSPYLLHLELYLMSVQDWKDIGLAIGTNTFQWRLFSLAWLAIDQFAY